MHCSIFLGEEEIGNARILTEGLYYHFLCRCRLSGDVMYQVIAKGTIGEVSLGVCVPMDGTFGINTRVPMKTVGDGPIYLRAIPKHKACNGEFIPIRADEPFNYIEKLEKAQYSVSDGIQSIWMPHSGEED